MIYLMGNVDYKLNDLIRDNADKAGFPYIEWTCHDKPKIKSDDNMDIERIYFDTWEEGEFLLKMQAKLINYYKRHK